MGSILTVVRKGTIQEVIQGHSSTVIFIHLLSFMSNLAEPERELLQSYFRLQLTFLRNAVMSVVLTAF